MKVLLAEAILELFENIPEGEQAGLRKNWSKSHSERKATTTEWGTIEKGESIAQCVNHNSKIVFFLSLFFFPWFLLACFLSFEELVLLVSQQSFVMEMRRDIICFLQPTIKYMEREKCFICM